MFSKHQMAWTKAEKERIRQALELGCCVTGVTRDVEIHHLLSGGKRMGHWFTIVLAKGVHQNLGLGATSIAHGSKAFEREHQTNDRRLWEATQRRLGLECNWPESKLVPRRMPLGHDWA